MSAPIDHLTYNRLAVAAAYRRLADAAIRAAEVFADPLAVPDEKTASDLASGRAESARHALIVLDATRRGIRKGRAA